MKKITVLFLLLLIVTVIFPSNTFASQGLVPPTSGLYFLQTWGENIKLFLTFSKDRKIDYLLDLTQRRVDEMTLDASSKVGDRYAEHFQDLENLSSQVPDKSEVVQRIKEASLRQQSVLAGVYIKVPDVAKDAIINAQENSSKHVINTIQAVEGVKSADTYTAQVQAIQKAEQAGKIEQVQMESGPNPNPSDSNINAIKGGQGINSLNSINGQNEGGGTQSVEPVPMK